MIYDVNGTVISSGIIDNESMMDNMELDYAYDSASQANYSVIRVFQTKRDGTKQYPFVRCPSSRTSTAAFAAAEPWSIIINAGLGVSADQPIDGVAIENGTVIYNNAATYHLGSQPLTIDALGNLGYAADDATGSSLIANNVVENDVVVNGIVSAICGFCPIIVDYAAVDPLPAVDINGEGNHFTSNAQRQIIGQFGNGDYAIVTCAGRNLDNSDGWTMAEAQAICIKLGLKFAYNLDGGKSTTTYLGKHPVYDFQIGTTRIIPSFIVFNGTTRFSLPTANGQYVSGSGAVSTASVSGTTLVL